MPEYLLGFDLGTTVLKAALFNATDGTQAACASIRLKIRSEPDGTREQDIACLDKAIKRAARMLKEQAGSGWEHVAGIGLAAQGGSAIIADRGSGVPHTSMQLWNDSRPRHFISQIASRAPEGYWRRLSYLDAPGAGLARMMWLRQHLPQLFNEQNIYVGAGEYFYFKLTSQWRQDAGNALQAGCYDARRFCIAAEPLRLIEVPVSFVAPMRTGHEVYPLTKTGAKLLGLKPGIPVAGPYMDHEAGFMSGGASNTRRMQCSLGTAWVASYIAEDDASLRGGAMQLVLPSPVGGGLLVLRVMLAGTTTWDWACSQFAAGSTARTHNRVERLFREKLLPPPGLVALPWLTHANPFDDRHQGAGGIVGIGPHTTRDDILRAVAAGMCFEFMRVTECVKDAGTLDSLTLAGGATRAWHFNRLLAALFQPLQVNVTVDQFAGARGTLYAFSPFVARAADQPIDACPKELCEQLREAYSLYRSVYDSLARALPNCPLLKRS